MTLVAGSMALAADPLTVEGPTRAQEGMQTVPGVRNVEVFHAPEGGWTYNHHVDLAFW
jgi:hypothetical protein